jgi:2-dehydro-3-deoxygluconokinase
MSPGGVHVVSFGECMLELQGQAFGTMHQTYGGDTLNTAVYLARCGRRAASGCRPTPPRWATTAERRPAAALGGRGPGLGLVRRMPGGCRGCT